MDVNPPSALPMVRPGIKRGEHGVLARLMTCLGLRTKVAGLLARATYHSCGVTPSEFASSLGVDHPVDLPRFRGEVRSWDQGIWFDGILSSSWWRSFCSAERIFSSRPAHCQGRRVEWRSRTAGRLAVRLAATFPGRSLTDASTRPCSCALGSR